jgi:hypothetical protein
MKMEFFFKKAYSDLIPRLSMRDYERLKKSIKDYGLQYPIVINHDKIVLDGHHRLQACHELGLPVSYIMKDFDKPLDELKYVVTININRRQLNKFQRAQIAIKFNKLYAGKTGGQSAKERMKAHYFTKETGRQAAIKRFYESTENLIEEMQSVFGS